MTICDAKGNEAVLSGTPEHPFFVPALNDYISMGELRRDTLLHTIDETLITVVDIEFRHGKFTVYNLEIDDGHNYFVSSPDGNDSGVLVHNMCKVKLKIINSNMGHAAERAVKRAGFSNVKDAREALQAFGNRIVRDGIPSNAITDPAHKARIIVPGFGDGCAVVYQVTSKGKLRLKTVLNWREPT